MSVDTLESIYIGQARVENRSSSPRPVCASALGPSPIFDVTIRYVRNRIIQASLCRHTARGVVFLLDLVGCTRPVKQCSREFL